MGYIEYIRNKIGKSPIILVGAVVIIMDNANNILLQNRKGSYNGMWGLPGGLMELGESTEETAKREVFEETGLTVENLKLIDLFSGSKYFVKLLNGDEFYSVTVLYYTKTFKGQLVIDEKESLDLRFFSIKNLPNNMVENHKEMLSKFLKEYKKES